MNQPLNFEAYNPDSESVDGGASVASSDWANLSSVSPTPEDQLSAKDVANWQELWQVWSTNQRISTVTAENIAIDHDIYQLISNVFRPSCHIPHLRLYLQPEQRLPCSSYLQEHLINIANHSPGLLDDTDAGLFSINEPTHVLALAATAMEVHEAALRVSQKNLAQFSDDVWATEVHDALFIRCAQGHLLNNSRSWPLPQLQLDAADYHRFSQLLDVCSVRPRGAMPILSGNEEHLYEPLFSAVFSTRSQIASETRDIPEHLALYAFSTMATTALLAPLAELGINTPIFGVMCDRNIVRFHVNWNAALPGGQRMGIVSLPLPHVDTLSEPLCFRELDLTQPDDALRVAFMLDAMRTYTNHVLAPAVRSSAMSTPSTSKLSFSQEEITSEEKVAAWMHYDADDTIVRSALEFHV